MHGHCKMLRFIFLKDFFNLPMPYLLCSAAKTLNTTKYLDISNIIIRNTYFTENNEMKKKKKNCKGLASKKKFLANMKDEILDFSFTYFNLSRCQMPPAHSNV